MKITSVFFAALPLIVLCVSSVSATAQTEQPQVTAVILSLDSAFWNAYNNCDTAHFKDFVTDSVEFYHDKGGPTIGAGPLIESLNKNICGMGYRVRRAAVEGSVKVYPMLNGDQLYGAIITGEHAFYMTEKGKPEYKSGAANFTHLWLLTNGVWKMSRILSYNHHQPEYINARKEIEISGQQLDQLTGIYESGQSGEMTLTKKNKILVLKGGNNIYMLYPLSPTSFFMKERDLVFDFVKDAAGKPVKMIVTENGAKADELMFVK